MSTSKKLGLVSAGLASTFMMLTSSTAFAQVAAAPANDAGRAEKLITSEGLRAHTRFLASDALEGRGPATKGDLLAQQYIATQFEALGLKPVGTASSTR